MSLLNPVIAQAAASPDNVSVGGVITAVMFIVTAVGSMAMIAAWVLRYSQTGHALPAAQRGVLRVPWGLTLFAAGLSVLFMILVLVSPLVDEVPVVKNTPTGSPAAELKIDSATEAVAATDEGSAAASESAKSDAVKSETPGSEPTTTETLTPKETETGNEVNPPAPNTNVTDESGKPSTENNATEKDAEKTAKKPAISPEKMQNALLQTIAMDLMMLLAFGGVVLVASQAGRVYLAEPGTIRLQASAPKIPMSGRSPGSFNTSQMYGTMWPDLDDASAIPQRPGYEILGERPAPKEVRNPIHTHRESAESTSSISGALPPEQKESTEYNPFAAGLQDSRTTAVAVAVTASEPQIPDESFSFTRELRFATEVFLAAYLPTTALRLLIVVISIAISGETPKSHPFLEMLDQGISVAMIAMIIVMAVFIAPVVEELQFRIVVLGGIAQLGWPKAALVFSSILFAFAHGFPDSIALIPLAFALGYTYLRRRSYVTVMLVHFIFNGFNMLLALAALL